jgi:hypothetical protein
MTHAPSERKYSMTSPGFILIDVVCGAIVTSFFYCRGRTRLRQFNPWLLLSAWLVVPAGMWYGLAPTRPWSEELRTARNQPDQLIALIASVGGALTIYAACAGKNERNRETRQMRTTPSGAKGTAGVIDVAYRELEAGDTRRPLVRASAVVIERREA